jgi:capsid protein
MLAGALNLPGFARDPAPYQTVKWIPPRWEWVDPLKDRKAEREAVAAGFKARSDVIEGEGYDPEEVDTRIAADREREKRLGLSLSIGHWRVGAPKASAPKTSVRGVLRAPRTLIALLGTVSKK